MFSYHPKLTRRTRLGYDPERSPEDTPLPPSPIIPPIHPFSHLISYIVVFRNAHPDWDSAGELWIHTHAEELMKDCGAGKENFERPIPLFKEIASGERLLFEGWFQLDKLRVVPSDSDELRELLERKEAGKSYGKQGRHAEAWAESLTHQWIKLRLTPSPPSSIHYKSLENPMKLKGGEYGEVEQYLLKVGGLESIPKF